MGPFFCYLQFLPFLYNIKQTIIHTYICIYIYAELLNALHHPHFISKDEIFDPSVYVCMYSVWTFFLTFWYCYCGSLFFFFCFFVLELWIQWKRLTKGRALHNFNQCSALSVTEVSSNQTMPFMNPWVGMGWGTIGICKGRSCWWFAFNCKYGTMAI